MPLVPVFLAAEPIAIPSTPLDASAVLPIAMVEVADAIVLLPRAIASLAAVITAVVPIAMLLLPLATAPLPYARMPVDTFGSVPGSAARSEEHTSELQS